MKDLLSGSGIDLLINLLAGLISFLAGLGFTTVREWFRLGAARKVWSLTRQGDGKVRVQIVAATLSEQVNQYDRHGTGMGEVEAYGAVQKSLQESYGKRLQPSFHFSRDFLLAPIDLSAGKEPQHLVVLGSAKYNEVTKDFHTRYPHLPLRIDFSSAGEPMAIVDKPNGVNYKPAFEVENGALTRDYGIVSRLPVSRGQKNGPTVFLIEGIRTYGVGAGGRLLVPPLVKQLQALTKHTNSDYWQAFFSVDVGGVDRTPILHGLVAVNEHGQETGRSSFRWPNAV